MTAEIGATVWVRHRNKEASDDLLIPVTVVCNTSDADLQCNITTNSQRNVRWLELAEAHDRPAVTCGSGPSLADHVDDVRAKQAAGAVVFALNGAARFLASHGIVADYQVMADAREKTADLIGPATTHLLASQCHPSAFDRSPNAMLWHLYIGDEMLDWLPKREQSFPLVGGTSAVGNAATCLAHTMGHRVIHCYGYDSSHRGLDGHAFDQPMNADEPLTTVTHRGVKYLTTLTMRSQADTFLVYADALESVGSTLHVHGTGLLPAMWSARSEPKTVETEQAKYAVMWKEPSYRVMSPAVEALPAIRAALAYLPDKALVVDLGCGTARATKALADRFSVLGVDFVDARDHDVPFIKSCLWELPTDLAGDAGICCDVMEHIPTERVDDVLSGIARAVPICVFTISFESDSMGALIGERLHLTVQPPEWWHRKLETYWPNVRHAGDGVFIARRT